MAHARRKFYELHAASKSQLAEQAPQHIGQLYEVERQVKDLDINTRRRIRQERSKPLANALHLWMQEQRTRVPDGSARLRKPESARLRSACFDPLVAFLCFDAQLRSGPS